MPLARQKSGGIRTANTTVVTEGGVTRVTLYATTIFTWDRKAGIVKLNTGGYNTPTTFRRMNEVLHHFGMTGHLVAKADFRTSNVIEFNVTPIAENPRRRRSKHRRNPTYTHRGKTYQKDYVVQGNYGHGWEDVNTEETARDAIRSRKEYDDNERGYAHRWIIRRSKVAQANPAGARRVTKREWYDLGGFANSKCFRKQARSGAWQYFVVR